MKTNDNREIRGMVDSGARKVILSQLIIFWCLGAFWSFYLAVVPSVADPLLFPLPRLLGFWIPIE
jgi:hypothetical protein